MQLLSLLSFVGIIIMILGGALILPVLPGLYYGEQEWSIFLLVGLITFVLGLTLNKTTLKYKDELYLREALTLVASSWLIASLISTIPYLLTNTFDNFTDAFFESMAGFTTTGTTVIPDLDLVSHTVLFWRSLTHWLGGMGIIILFIALMSTLKMGGNQLFKAEIPGSIVQKIKPRISQTALILWLTYVIMTIVLILLLWFVGMPFFDAVCHGLVTVATAGCSIKNESIGFYDNYIIYWIIIIFMFLAGSNFVLYYSALKERSLLRFWRNAEFRLYTKIILFFILIMFLHLIWVEDVTFGAALTMASFKVVSSITTTGYTIADYQNWSSFAQTIIITLLLIGGCNGSTSGSIKVGRYLILFKQSIAELRQAIHPRAIINLKMDGKKVDEQLLINVLTYFFLFVFLIFSGTLFLSFLDLDMLTAFSAVVGSISNGGLGLSEVGPGQNFIFIPAVGKYMLTFLMLLGRLEIFTVLVLFSPAFWRK